MQRSRHLIPCRTAAVEDGRVEAGSRAGAVDVGIPKPSGGFLQAAG
jgi:hypothetical protein